MGQYPGQGRPRMNPLSVELSEYKTEKFPREKFSDELMMALKDDYGTQISIDPPSVFNNNTWHLTAQGWAGYIPFRPDVHFRINTKVPVRNLFAMLEYAYDLKGFKILEGLIESESIEDLYDLLAIVLAKRILGRIRKGIYRNYLEFDDKLPYVRGRLDVLAHVKSPEKSILPCCFEEHTADLADNQILLWTLTRILMSGVPIAKSRIYVQQAQRSLQGFVSTTAFSAKDCIKRLYGRMNQDYEPMHALCRFFLEHMGPTHHAGNRLMLPVLIDMERLFELFVAEWLKKNVPSVYRVRSKENVQLHMGHLVSISIDITIEDTYTGRTICVLDTKYKAPDTPATEDIYQVVSYAEAKGCSRAVLIYPLHLPSPIQGLWGNNIRVESLAFPLDSDLDEAGQQFLEHLFS